MAGLWYDSTDPEVINVWEKELDREVRVKSPLFDPKNGFVGSSASKLIQIKEQLTEGPGSNIRTKLRYQLEGRGRSGNEPLKGHGEAYKTSTFNIYVDVLRHYVETSSPMVDQYVPEDTLEEGKDGLADWFASRFEFAVNLHATGFSAITDNAYDLANTIRAMQTNYIIRPNSKAAATDLTSADTFDLDVLNTAARQLKLLRPLIRPIDSPIGEVYAVFLSPEQVHDLRKSDSVWFATMQNALKGGYLKDNPLFVNALGMSQGFVFFEDQYVPPGLSADTQIVSNTRRAWIGGAQALCLAFGRGRAPQGYGLNRFRWDRETEDFGHIGQIAATTIVGMARPYYTKPGGSEHNNGTLVIETYAAHGLTDAVVYEPWLTAGATMN